MTVRFRRWPGTGQGAAAAVRGLGPQSPDLSRWRDRRLATNGAIGELRSTRSMPFDERPEKCPKRRAPEAKTGSVSDISGGRGSRSELLRDRQGQIAQQLRSRSAGSRTTSTTHPRSVTQRPAPLLRSWPVQPRRTGATREPRALAPVAAPLPDPATRLESTVVGSDAWERRPTTGCGERSPGPGTARRSTRPRLRCCSVPGARTSTGCSTPQVGCATPAWPQPAATGLVTYSRKVFIPLTRMCRDRCHYCTFATTPGTAARRRRGPVPDARRGRRPRSPGSCARLQGGVVHPRRPTGGPLARGRRVARGARLRLDARLSAGDGGACARGDRPAAAPQPRGADAGTSCNGSSRSRRRWA